CSRHLGVLIPFFGLW
nr:immunoglobulin heavy chain junction region [Macaca mulatta]MOW46792.1 immunoglobulin heavy chain junction region [Macaca mulatta]MOW48102.1 immunoglobulin heavy chain junction region [Macaca mulatta]MOW48654.1 immunoglobulin heavy chain junction region [Macaca mulatta]MOW48680.1 immunoglobulin heavy chain junction region [Macaca mulatta]